MAALDQPVAAQAASTKLPHWDMTPVFPSLESAEFEAAYAGVLAGIGELRQLCDRHGVRQTQEATVDEASTAAFEAVTERLNTLSESLRTVYAYLHAFVATDSRNDLAQAKVSELQTELVELEKLETRYTAWIGSLDVEALIARSPVARDHAFAIRKAAEEARHQMSEAEEDLAASLSLSGGTAWAKLHGNVSSQLVVPVHFPPSRAGKPGGKTEELPMSAVRGLAHDPDPEVRKAAYDAELAGWERVAVPLAAAMNGIKGQVNTLNQRRGWRDALEPALFANNVDRATLEAMHAACRDAFPDFRRYLRAKARLLGKALLPWWDIFAPVGGSQRRWEFDEAGEFVVAQFGTYSPALAELARRAIRERWIDAEPRTGKRDGAFCMGVRRDESRVFLNYEPSFNSVHTLSHELGHAYHNTTLARRTPMQRDTPMPLAETASIFCQTIVTNAALAQASGEEKLSILEGDLQDACQVVVDIHSRFLFEQRVFERRARRELSVQELNELMLDAQRETYGDGLDQQALHPYMWAVKPHYYSSRSFYNWPYTFGLLFGLGLYARYREDPERFRAGYDDLLSSTGLAGAAELGRRFGIEVGAVEFWRASLDVCRERVAEFERLAAAASGAPALVERAPRATGGGVGTGGQP
ncbi:MAG TPA: M3 family oligoendopeptidase [Chloroflexota bacterium]|jgi:oligoendopeptidase F|nr:M3 family oligoendopeptidase [Chloroflexota bacterium]